MRTCKAGPNLLLHATLLTGPYQYTKFERDRISRRRDLERPWPCTCARAVTPHLRHMGIHCQVGAYTHAKLVGEMKLPYKRNASKSVQWLRRYKHGKSVATADQPAAHGSYSVLSAILPSTKDFARSLVITCLTHEPLRGIKLPPPLRFADYIRNLMSYESETWHSFK